mgnify:CR=1 FL=1
MMQTLQRTNSKRGIVIFVVLGAVVVLGVLVASYNFLVRGKFNETHEILQHLRALKCAQATSNYIMTNLISDLETFESDSPGYVLRTEVFQNNDATQMSDALSEKWLSKLDTQNFVNTLLYGLIGNEKLDYEIQFGFTDIKTLEELKSLKGVDDSVYFFPTEKIGRMTVKVTIMIGRTREVWQETRPFKMVFPFPVPITKFNLYWKDGVTEACAFDFNTVCVDAEKGKTVNGKKPLLLDNGSTISSENKDPNLWHDRGWVYIGGSDLMLNRACGDRGYGQRIYSYPRPGFCATLHLNFPQGDYLDDTTVKGEKLGFRTASWGFSESVLGTTDDNTWRKIMKGEYEDHPVDTNKNRWLSSSLHIFSDEEVFRGSDDINPSITRVIGKVYDRYLNMGYLLPKNSSNVFFAAVVNYTSKESHREANEDGEVVHTYNTEGISGISDTNLDKYLYTPNGFNLETTDANNVQAYFDRLTYEDSTNPYAVSYSNVMSRISYNSIEEVYDLIAQYSSSNDIGYPAPPSVPKPNVTQFGTAELELGPLPAEMKNIEIPSIGEVEDTTLGLGLRTCYELKGTSEEIINSLRTEFGSYSDSFGIGLNNLVYKLKPSDEPMNLGDGLNLKSAGTIYADNGLRVGTIVNADDAESNPLMLLTRNGAITLNNSDSNDVNAYLIALGEGGTVKVENQSSAMRVRGGMAVREFTPENIPNGGGYIAYNRAFDPLKVNFLKYFGLAIGPVGGEL